MKKTELKKIIKEEISRVREFDNDNIDKTMKELEGIVRDMKRNLRDITFTLTSEPELSHKAKEVEMDIKSLNHKLDVLKEKLSL